MALRTLLLLIFLSHFANCQSERGEYYVEDRLLRCIYEQYSKVGVDLGVAVDSVSEALVKYKILAGRDGRSYIELLKTLNATGRLPVKPSGDLFAILNSIELPPFNFVCKERIFNISDSSALSRSKFRYLPAIVDSIQMKGDLSLKSISSEILEVFTEKDFDHRFYSTIATMAIANLVRTDDSEILATLPPPPQIDFSQHPNLHVLHLELTSDDKLKVNNREMGQEQAARELEKFILTHGKDHALSVTTTRATSHRLFVSVIDLIEGMYKRIREKYAADLYKKPYAELNEQSKKTVIEKYPTNVSIAEPTR
jgi:hypothetical protein